MQIAREMKLRPAQTSAGLGREAASAGLLAGRHRRRRGRPGCGRSPWRAGSLRGREAPADFAAAARACAALARRAPARGGDSGTTGAAPATCRPRRAGALQSAPRRRATAVGPVARWRAAGRRQRSSSSRPAPGSDSQTPKAASTARRSHARRGRLPRRRARRRRGAARRRRAPAQRLDALRPILRRDRHGPVDGREEFSLTPGKEEPRPRPRAACASR